MKLTFNTGLASVYSNGELGVLVNVPTEYKSEYDQIMKLMDTDCLKEFEIKKKSEKRTLSANGYLFSLLGQIANKMGLSLGDCYVKHIKDYGVFVEGSYMTKQAFEVFEPSYSKVATKLEHSSSMCAVTREFAKNGIEWVEYVAFIGSSEYDKKQFSVLLDGVITEAKELGIETMGPQEIQSLIDKMEEL